MTLILAGKSRELAPGQLAVVPPATSHRWGTVGGRPSHVLVRLTPALGIEGFFAT